MNGWVMYVSGSADPSYFDRQIYLSELGKNVYVRDYASACYIRTGWKSLNPADGKYAWDDPSTPIYKLVARAEELGLPIAFRVVVDGRDQREHPRFVFDAGAEYWLENDRYPDRKTPLAMDPIWRQYYENSCAHSRNASTMRRPQHLSTPMVSANGAGTQCVLRTGQRHHRKDRRVQGQYNGVDHTSLCRQLHRGASGNQLPPPAWPSRKLWQNAQPDSEALLAIAIRNGYCLRSDAIGMNNAEWGYNSWEKAFARTWNYKLPILMEGGWIVGSAQLLER